MFGVWDDSDYGGLGLHLWLWDGNEYIKDADLSPDWILDTTPGEGEEDGGEYDSAQQATVSLVPLKTETLDISTLKEKADEAVKQVADYLPK